LISFTLPLDATESSRRSYLGKSGAVEPTSSDLSTHDPTRGVYNQTEFLQSLQRPYVPSDRLPRFIRGASVKVDQFTAPPEAVFVFGNLYLVGYLAGLEIAYSAFNRELVPLRAEARISFKVKESEKLVINPDVTRFANQGFSTNSSRVL
jgi:hypothetical protein